MTAPNRFWTIPNILSLSRLLLLPVWWWLMASPNPSHRIWGGGLILYAIGSDIIDGWIARKYNQSSQWGRLLDPIGDKVSALVVGVFCVMYRSMPWPALALCVTRDLALIVGGWIIYRRTRLVPVSVDLGRYAALLWGIVLLLYTFELQPYANYTLWPVVAVYLLAGGIYATSLWKGEVDGGRAGEG